MSVLCTYLGMRSLTPFTHQYPLETQQGIEWGRVDYRPQVRAFNWESFFHQESTGVRHHRNVQTLLRVVSVHQMPPLQSNEKHVLLAADLGTKSPEMVVASSAFA